MLLSLDSTAQFSVETRNTPENDCLLLSMNIAGMEMDGKAGAT